MRHAIGLAAALVVVAFAATPGVAVAQNQVEVTGIRLAAFDDASGGPFSGGGELFVSVRGSTDGGSKVVRGMLLPVAASCPATWEGEPDNELRMYEGNGSVQGSFTGDLLSPAVALQAWRACVYLRDELVYPTVDVAMADRVVEPQVAPRNQYRPSTTAIGLGSRRVRLRCNPGDWVAWPKPAVRYAWKVGGKRVRGATRRLLSVRPGARVSCGVTLRNALGARTAWSRTRRA